MARASIASPWRRLASYLIDSLVVGLFYMVFFVSFTPMWWVERYASVAAPRVLVAITVLFAALYYIFFIGYRGATPGMQFMNLKAVKENYKEVDYTTAFARYLGMMVSGVIIDIGYFWILVDKNNQGWHDRIAGTLIVKVK